LRIKREWQDFFSDIDIDKMGLMNLSISSLIRHLHIAEEFFQNVFIEVGPSVRKYG
jgi:hypothetical protein